MSKDNKHQDHVADMIRNIERIENGNRRIGTRDRDMHTEYVNEAYAGGYLDDEELAERQVKITAAKWGDDLKRATGDLPSFAELKGRKNVPVKAQKRAFWLINFYTKHPVLAPLMSLVLGLLIAITPGTTFDSLKLTHLFPFNMVMVMTIIVGVAMAFASIVRFIWLVIDEDSPLYTSNN